MNICQNEVLSEERQLMKWVGIFRVKIFWVGFRGEFSREEFDGWEFSRGGGGNFFRSENRLSKIMKNVVYTVV